MASLIQYFRNILLFVFFGFSTATYAANTTVKQNKNQQDKPIIVSAKSPTFTIKIPSNPSTGYSWFLKSYNHELLKPKNYHYNPANNNTAGAPGISEWIFEADNNAFNVPQVATIVLQYMRPWEAKAIKTKTITVVFRAKS